MLDLFVYNTHHIRMIAQRLSITLRPYIFEKLKAKAASRQVSISRQIEDFAERCLEEDLIITPSDTLEASKKVAASFDNADELMSYIHEQAERRNR